jgi:hypothetical protein
MVKTEQIVAVMRKYDLQMTEDQMLAAAREIVQAWYDGRLERKAQ